MRVLFGHNKDQGGHLLAGHGLSSADGALSAYAVAGVLPSYVMDTENGIYYDGIYYDGPNQLHDHATTSNRTVVDSDGLIKWAPHNIALNSASPATQSITVVSGADYTVAVRGSGSMTLSNAGTGTATDGSPVEITASTTTLTITLTGSLDKVWAYRSDLGGMQSTGNAADPTYVPTEGSAVYWMGTDHDPVTGEVLGVQGEPAATNLLPYSEDYTDAAWAKQDIATVSAPSVTGPDGSVSGTVIQASAVTGSSIIYELTGSLTSGAATTQSFFVKAGSHRYVQISLQGTSTENFISAVFDVGADNTQATETDVGTSSGTISSTKQEKLSNGWFRLSISGQVSDTALYSVLGFASASTGNTFLNTGQVTSTWAGTETFNVFGAQFETGSLATSYIPTAGATATRAAPSVSKPLSEVSADLDEIVVVTEFECTDVAADAVVAALDDASTDLIHFRAHTSQANLFVQDGGVTQADVDAGAISANTQYRAAFKMAADDFLASLGGATAVADTSGTMPTPTTLRLFNSSGAAPLTGIRVKKLIVYAGAAGALDAIDATALEGAAA